MTKTIMVQGCTSDAGKSVLVAGLCRVLKRRGLSVAPFKPQNMALNSEVTEDGGEIGRAQAVQARACGLSPHIDMNPVLLKPNSDTGAQVIIHGKALTNMEAAAFHDYKKYAMDAVLASHQRLQAQYDFIIVEGAGSPAEINLREGDIANMGFAEAVDCPVLLIADIDRGGIFAHFTGTVALLSPSEQARIKGYVVNRFRGELALLQSGLDWLEHHTSKPVMGVLPYIHNLHLEAEDAIATQQDSGNTRLNVAVPVFSRISNHTDFDVLRMHPDIHLSFVGKAQSLRGYDLIILPGTKNTRGDLAFLRDNDWDKDIAQHLRYGGKLIGICGGFQMLGTQVHDPLGIEGASGSSDGLGFLDFATILEQNKVLRQVNGQFLDGGATCRGYEIHAGKSTGAALAQPLLDLGSHVDGARSADDQILGTYVHGIFDDSEALGWLLRWAGLEDSAPLDYAALIEANIDRLADTLEKYLDIERILQL